MREKTYLFWNLFLCATGFSITSQMVMSGEMGNFDHKIGTLIQSNHSIVLTKAAKLVSLMGGPKLELGIALVLLFLAAVYYGICQGKKMKAIVSKVTLFSAAMSITYYSNFILKGVFHRSRPLHPLGGGYSFPSDHAMMAIAFYIMGVYLLWEYIRSSKGRIVLATVGTLMPLLISVSRIYLQKHYPSDILAGFFASGFILSLMLLLWGYWQKGQDLTRGEKAG